MGTSQISVLVTDGAEPRPVVVTIYTVHIYRESRPSLPAFGDHVTCSFLQVGQGLGVTEPLTRVRRVERLMFQNQKPGRSHQVLILIIHEADLWPIFHFSYK